MGVEMRGGDGGRPGEYLLYAAICMVGLPVEVQVRDGSLYSGILHTASFDVHAGHGIILKKARKIGKGKHEKSFPVGSFVDTLVVFSADFVQVVAKDFLLPADGGVNAAGDDGFVAGTVESHACNFDSESTPNLPVSSNHSHSGIQDHSKEKLPLFGLGNKDPMVDAGLDIQKMLHDPSNDKKDVEARRQDSRKAVELSLAPTPSALVSQIGEDMLQAEGTSRKHVVEVSDVEKMVHKDHHPLSISSSPPQADSVDDAHSAISLRTTSNETRCSSPAARPVRPDGHPESILTNSTNYPSLDAPISTASTHSTSFSDSRPSPCTSLPTSPNVPYSKNNSSSKPSAREFKLNPGAKIFSPMSASSRSSPTPVPPNASAGYISSIPPVMPITVAQSGVEIASFASRPTPAKLVQYDSLVTGHSGVPVQYSRPVIGQANAWQPPVRFSGQFQPIQAGPAYVHPTSQTVVVGRTGQLVYVHPIAQDATQGATVLSQGSPYPLLNACQTSLPKIQGAAAPPLQLCMAPPLVTGATQPFTVPGHIPFTQPFPAVRPILVPSGNGYFGSKLQ